MERYLEDYQKRRLTERVDIMTAIDILKSQGYNHDELIAELTKVFFVDLDAYNEVVVCGMTERVDALCRQRQPVTRFISAMAPNGARTLPSVMK